MDELTKEELKVVLTSLAFMSSPDVMLDINKKMEQQAIEIMSKIKNKYFKRAPKLNKLSYFKDNLESKEIMNQLLEIVRLNEED